MLPLQLREGSLILQKNTSSVLSSKMSIIDFRMQFEGHRLGFQTSMRLPDCHYYIAGQLYGSRNSPSSLYHSRYSCDGTSQFICSILFSNVTGGRTHGSWISFLSGALGLAVVPLSPNGSPKPHPKTLECKAELSLCVPIESF